MSEYVNLWRCRKCGWKGEVREILIAQNPFDESLTCAGCPKCKNIEQFEQLCDSCEGYAEVGFPIADGYRWTCGKHCVVKADS